MFDRSVERAADAVSKAEDRCLAAMRRAYPIGGNVKVVHSRGVFRATVVDYDIHGTRIVVVNCVTGKRSAWWYRNVERVVVSKRGDRRVSAPDVCPRCGEPFDDEQDGIYECPQCGIAGSSKCCNPGGNRCLCYECEEAQSRSERGGE